MKSLFKLFGFLFLVFLLFISILITVAYLYLKINLPSINRLKNYRPVQTNLIIDTNGKVIGFLGQKKRIFVPLNKIPSHVIHAFIAAEDARFYEHKGIDFLSLLRALYKDIVAGKIVQGGSTITQQVVRNLLLSPERTIQRKIKEMILAWQIEKYLTKDEILTIYLNHIYLGEGAYGVEAASLTYFNKHVWELNLNEAAVLAGLPRAPSLYDPIKNPKLAISRRNYVLRRMAEVGYISWETAKKLSKQPIKLNPRNISIPAYTGYFIDAVKQELKRILPSQILYRGGLTIQTTLDLDWQKKAYKNALITLKRIFKNKKLPQLAVVCMDNRNGGVRVLIGGNDYLKTPFNRVILAKRQVGSAFKPFVWAEALEKGIITPYTVLPDDPIIIQKINNGKDWAPENYDGKYWGPIDVKTALAHSRNVVAVRIALLLGLQNIKEISKALEFNLPKNINYSIALGAYELTPLEVVKAYTIFPNLGKMVEPRFIEAIYDGIYEKHLIYKNIPEFKPVISSLTAGIMNDFLMEVVKNGTGKCALKLGVPSGGKTGTTENYKDAWFIGYTPAYTCGVWVGYDKPKTLGRGATGGRIACPVWLSVMKSTKLHPEEIPIYRISPEEISESLTSIEPGLTQNETFKENKTLFQKIWEFLGI